MNSDTRLTPQDGDLVLLLRFASDTRRQSVCAEVCQRVARETLTDVLPAVRDALILVSSGRTANSDLIARLDVEADRFEEQYYVKREEAGDSRADFLADYAALKAKSHAINAVMFAAKGTTAENVAESFYEALFAADDEEGLRSIMKAGLSN